MVMIESERNARRLLFSSSSFRFIIRERSDDTTTMGRRTLEEGKPLTRRTSEEEQHAAASIATKVEWAMGACFMIVVLRFTYIFLLYLIFAALTFDKCLQQTCPI